ncbi:MAG: 2,3-bisphosphoglycerate-independent phosphoglycerate mutase [Legionellales bacterium]|nr:2,3-bisphosphoglycerate-independent phosphoglycerate mutase [Legionellales bacterium]
MILDGWGYRHEKKYNAIAQAHTPHWVHWWQTRPHTLLEASGPAVGLPKGQMGNSEVGHMHIGAGRVIPQDFTRINDAIHQGVLEKNEAFIETIEDMKHHNKTLHIMGLLSPGGVHSHEKHLFALLTLCDHLHFTNVCLHLFLDGRDTPPQSALPSFQRLEQFLQKHPVATICSISGRYYAMDRDQRWPRTETVYRLLTEGHTDHHFTSPEACIESNYASNINDEFIPPSLIGKGSIIQDGDSVLCFNFRADRVRQLTEALINQDFHGFHRIKTPKIAHAISMTDYGHHLNTRIAFPHLILHNTLGEVLEHQGLTQLRLSETEKYAHVTYFFNGGSEQVFSHEHRVLIPSPKVSTYDEQPEMSAVQLTRALISAIQNREDDVIICNYANADMVGHTGDFEATIRAIECLDKAMYEVWQALDKVGGQMLITADHGNAESMFDDTTQQAHTAHTNHPVPLLYLGENGHFNTEKGCLIDVAPTLLQLLHLPIPREMTGKSLWVEEHVTHD